MGQCRGKKKNGLENVWVGRKGKWAKNGNGIGNLGADFLQILIKALNPNQKEILKSNQAFRILFKNIHLDF
jgi:hypothetical protein